MKTLQKLSTSLRLAAASACMVAVVAAMSACPANAQQNGEAPSARQVIVGGVLFLTVRDAWGGYTPEQRAAQVQQRINAALSEGPIRRSDISVAKVDGDWIVELKGKRLYTADYDTAKLDQTAPQALANKWAAFLKATLPSLTAPTNGPAH